MGNCFGTCEPNSVVRVAKLDGKILEFSSPVLVRDVLKNFPAFNVVASKEASDSEHLSPDYELKVGRLYYLLSSVSCSPDVSSTGNREPTSGTKRVKVVITKKQLQMLVANQISIEDILPEAHDRSSDLPSNWKPKLDSIPEGNE